MNNISEIYIALDNIRSLYNVGAICRLCSFFNVKHLILIGISGQERNQYDNHLILHQKLKKTALGAEKDLEITSCEDIADFLQFVKSKNLTLISIEQHNQSKNILNWKPQPGKYAFVFGHERSGVSKELLNQSAEIVEIPRKGKHDSLNVSTACAIVLYHLLLSSLQTEKSQYIFSSPNLCQK